MSGQAYSQLDPATMIISVNKEWTENQNWRTAVLASAGGRKLKIGFGGFNLNSTQWRIITLLQINIFQIGESKITITIKTAYYHVSVISV